MRVWAGIVASCLVSTRLTSGGGSVRAGRHIMCMGALTFLVGSSGCALLRETESSSLMARRLDLGDSAIQVAVACDAGDADACERLGNVVFSRYYVRRSDALLELMRFAYDRACVITPDVDSVPCIRGRKLRGGRLPAMHVDTGRFASVSSTTAIE